ncbi:MAG: DUF4433 domain-containing protein [Microbacteriaceae bacterium]|nr:DUF4433 domain-containing protein [Microbacteriaceae bacterium]
MAECIHGLEAGLCDQCFPKAVPVLEVVTAAGQRNARAKAAVTRRAASAASKTVESVGDQRIYHLTHVRNLAGILVAGAILADGNESWTTDPPVNLSSSETRQSRRATAVSGLGSANVAEFVPFFLVPNSTMWEDIRSDSPDPRLSSHARGVVAADFVLLVSTLKNAAEQSEDGAIVVTDGDAAHVLTRFAASTESSERMLRRLRADDNAETIVEAELLVKHRLPFELVTLIGVANDRVRDEVRGMLKGSAYSPKVSVYPPWFQKPEA